MKQSETMAAVLIAVLLPPALGLQNAKAQSLPGVPSTGHDRTINIQQMVRDFIGSDPEWNKDFTIKAEGAGKQYTRTVMGSPAEMQATLPVPEQVKAIEDQIQAAQSNIERLKQVPVEVAVLLILTGTNGSVSNPTEEQVLQLVSAQATALEAQLADARKELATAQTREKDIPHEFREVARAMEYMADEKVGLIQQQIADTQQDISYVQNITNHSATDRQGLIDRKTALLDKTLVFLTKQKKLLQGQDPRP